MKYLFVWILISLAGEVLAHDPHLYTSVIVNDDDEWRLKMTFGSGGLETAMQTYFGNPSLELNQSGAFKRQIVKYLQSHVDIKVNKFFDVNLEVRSIMITDHASEIIFRLNVPPRPEYWNVSITACQENERATHMLRTVIEGKSNMFKLSKKEGLSIVLISAQNGELKELKKVNG